MDKREQLATMVNGLNLRVEDYFAVEASARTLIAAIGRLNDGPDVITGAQRIVALTGALFELRCWLKEAHVLVGKVCDGD